MAEMDDTFELKGLEQLIKAMKTAPPKLYIGVLGGGGRSDGKENATIGAVHEFGAPARNIPARSFLRIPLIENLNRGIEEVGLTDEPTLKEVVRSGSILPWLKKVAVVAEGIVDDAFETSGGGKWAPWKNPNYHNEGGMLLVDTGSLRQSITSEVKE